MKTKFIVTQDYDNPQSFAAVMPSLPGCGARGAYFESDSYEKAEQFIAERMEGLEASKAPLPPNYRMEIKKIFVPG